MIVNSFSRNLYLRKTPTPKGEVLNTIRLEYLRCAKEGMTAEETADTLGRSIETVRQYARKNGIVFKRPARVIK